MNKPLPVVRDTEELPRILVGNDTPQVRSRVERFYFSVAEAFETWVTRRSSAHTQRAYRQDLRSLIEFLGITWPNEAWRMLAASVADVQNWRDELIASGAAPKTLNRRVSSVSSFYKYLANAAADMRLPIVVPNPAHAQFISRESTDPVDETKALTVTRARQLMVLPSGDNVLDYRDRAILKCYLYSGCRLTTGLQLRVADLHQEGVGATIRVGDKGKKRRTIGLNFVAADAISQYIEQAGITSGALFRVRLNPRSKRLGNRALAPVTMYKLIMSYLERLPGAMKEHADPDGTTRIRCIYTPHSLRATVATLLLDAGVDIVKVQELLGHRHITTTQIYDKRRRRTSESASHDVPI